MRSIVAGVIGVWFFLGPCCLSANGDGGTVRLSLRRSDYLITVFSSPSPFRAGPVDISVLVQHASTGEPVPQARVTVRMTKMGLEPLEHPATHEVATNKLLHAAEFEIPAPGRWQLEVKVEGSHGIAVVGCELEAADPLPPLFEMWPWISAPALVVAVFGFLLSGYAKPGGTCKNE
jgi:hypothetical protein